MIACSGCGREIDSAGIEEGAKFLCTRCYHLHIAGPPPARTLGSVGFTAVAYICLAVLALAGFALCLLYRAGTGSLPWFIFLTAMTLIVIACPAAVLLKKRNLALFLASVYLPLGVWAYTWFLAPGADWEYGAMTFYGGLLFFVIGLIALGLFIRDMRALPRL